MDISTQEAQLIVEALTLIAPTGGSSAAYAYYGMLFFKVYSP
jgi:hypothetical protein